MVKESAVSSDGAKERGSRQDLQPYASPLVAAGAAMALASVAVEVVDFGLARDDGQRIQCLLRQRWTAELFTADDATVVVTVPYIAGKL